jgi:tRNA(adenine34) deaminase
MQKDEDYMQMALEEANKAFRQDEVPVGAVITTEDGILARAHNSPISLSDPSAHAEILAIRRACEKTGNYRLSHATLYVTLEPCLMCAGAILQARLKRVVFGTRDPKAGAVVSLYQILSDHRLNHEVNVTEGVFYEACSEILSRFFHEKRIKASPRNVVRRDV